MSERRSSSKKNSRRKHSAPPKNSFIMKGSSQEEGAMRIQRALARAGVASRREADKLVAAGRVLVNNSIAVTGQIVDPSHDIITVDGVKIATAVSNNTWIVLHKPAGVMTTRSDPEGRQTVFDLVDPVPGLVYVGRLDFLTEGLLLLTTDGKAAHRLTHPSREVERTYVAIVRGDAPAAVREARRGIVLDDGPVHPVSVHADPIGERRWAFEITVVDGRTREIRRICEALDLQVDRLIRTRYGPVDLGELAPGEVRPLTAREKSYIQLLCGKE